MKFLEKVKNLFTEEVEEDEEVKVEPIKKEVTHVVIESPNVHEEVDKEEENLQEIVNYVSKEKPPVFFDDEDFEELNLTEKKVEEPKKEVEVYGNKIEQEKLVEEKKVFKPTPIISPVYGILDKNYRKEDIVSKNDVKQDVTTKESPIDTIRNKAYGTLEDELEDTLFGSNSILFKKNDEPKEEKLEVKEIDDNALNNLTDDISKELDEILVKKEKRTESRMTKDVDDEDLLGFIDSTLYRNGDE